MIGIRPLQIAGTGCLCLMALIAITGQSPAGETWTSFQNGGVMSLAAAKAPSGRLASDIDWTAELRGYGQSSPVAWDGQVYVTTVEGDQKQTCHVAAFRLENGAPIWQYEVKNASPHENSNYVSKAAPSPAVDAAGIICLFEGGNLVALTHAGELRWQRNLVEDYGELGARHGLSASVEQDEQSAFVWLERSEEPYVLALDKETGKTLWKVPGIGATSWSSPRLVPVEDGRHLVLSAVGSLVGLDPQNGQTLWRNDDIAGNSTPTPVPLGDGQFLIGATVGRGESGGGKAAESNGVVAISRNAKGEWSTDYVWRAERATSSFGSPIAHNGLAYFVNRTGVLYALDLATGEEQFAKRLSGSTWATPLGLGDRVFFFGKDGSVDVLTNPGPKPEVATWASLPDAPQPEGGEAEGPVSGAVLYAASLCDGRVLLRRGDRLFAVDFTTE